MPNIPPKHGSISSIIILTGLYLSIFLVGLLYNAINIYVCDIRISCDTYTWCYMVVSTNGESPNGWLTVENPILGWMILGDDFEVLLFQETSISTHD